MKVSLNWLREYVEIPGPPAELADLLTRAGVEVEGVHPRGVDLEKVVVAQILASEPHPNADRLSVCRVDDGAGRTVVAASDRLRGEELPGRRQGPARAAGRGFAGGFPHQGRQAARGGERGDALLGQGTRRGGGLGRVAHPAGGSPRGRAHRGIVPGGHGVRPGNHPEPAGPALARGPGAGDRRPDRPREPLARPRPPGNRSRGSGTTSRKSACAWRRGTPRRRARSTRRACW